jgi:hypothetical protein
VVAGYFTLITLQLLSHAIQRTKVVRVNAGPGPRKTIPEQHQCQWKHQYSSGTIVMLHNHTSLTPNQHWCIPTTAAIYLPVPGFPGRRDSFNTSYISHSQTQQTTKQEHPDEFAQYQDLQERFNCCNRVTRN